MSLEVYRPSTSRPPSRSLALERIETLEEAALDLLAQHASMHRIVNREVNPGKGVVPVFGWFDRTRLHEPIEVLLHERLGLACAGVRISDESQSEDRSVAHRIDACQEWRLR